MKPNLKLEVKNNRVYVHTNKPVACNTELLYDGRDCTFLIPQSAESEHASRLFFMGTQKQMFPTRTINFREYIHFLEIPLNQKNRDEMLHLIHLAQTKVNNKEGKEILFTSK